MELNLAEQIDRDADVFFARRLVDPLHPAVYDHGSTDTGNRIDQTGKKQHVIRYFRRRQRR